MIRALGIVAIMIFQVVASYGQTDRNDTLLAPPVRGSLQERSYRNRVLHIVDSLLEANYVLPEKAGECAAAFRKLYTSGAYDSCADAMDFAEKVRVDLVKITHDRHTNFRVIQASDIGEKVESNLHHAVRYYRLRIKEHTGFTKFEWINGRIGYLELRRFNSLSEAKELLGAAMKFLAGADAIIIDVRENGGGSGDYLSSYFLPHPTQLTGYYYRDGNDLQEAWTSGKIEGKRMLEVPVFVLTSRKTFSAAESFAYDMKVRKRAIIIGDSTKGGAHDTGYFKIDDQFEMYLSVGRAINPVSHSNWEGIGVIPDVLVPASSALDTAIVLAGEAAERFGREKETKLRLAVQEMEVHLSNSERLYGEKKDRLAKAALDSVFDIGRKFNLITEFFINVLAYNYRSPGNERILIATLKKNIEFFPESPTAYESLAEGYLSIGNQDQAITCYRKALLLDPDNRRYLQAISRLQQNEKTRN